MLLISSSEILFSSSLKTNAESVFTGELHLMKNFREIRLAVLRCALSSHAWSNANTNVSQPISMQFLQSLLTFGINTVIFYNYLEV